MNNTLVKNFMQDLKVEAVKLNLQLSCPADKYQDNEVLGTLTATELDSVHAMVVIRKAIADLSVCESLVDINTLYNEWNEFRIDIQYKREYDSVGKGEAYAYIFLMRLLKNRHKELYTYMKMFAKI